MPKIVDAKPTIAERIVGRHEQARAGSRKGEQSEAWKLVGEMLEISGKIFYICTFKMLISTLRATYAGIATFFREMSRGL